MGRRDPGWVVIQSSPVLTTRYAAAGAYAMTWVIGHTQE
jgi:hypothetical protein